MNSPLLCSHPSGFYTHAYVPGGYFCDHCGLLVWQSFIPANQPDALGYISADWAWHYRDNRPWTTQNKINAGNGQLDLL
jgi:hypothetical protein